MNNDATVPSALDSHLAVRLDRAPVLHLAPSELFLESPIQKRSDYPQADHLALMASLEENGQINDATARRSLIDGQKVIELIAGFRRARAIQDPNCALTRLRVKVLDHLTDAEAEQIRMHENLNRTAPTHFDRAEDAHRLVHRVFRGSKHAVSEAAVQMNCDSRAVRRYLELFAACEESPTLKQASQRQNFKMGLVKVWLDKNGPELDGYTPASEQEKADHPLRLKAAAHLFRLAAPDRAVEGSEKVEAITVSAFGARLAELVASLPGQEVATSTERTEAPLLVQKRNGAKRLRSVLIDPSVPLELRVELREQVVKALPELFGANDVELEGLRHAMLEVVAAVEHQINGLRVARNEAPRYGRKAGRRKPASEPPRPPSEEPGN